MLSHFSCVGLFATLWTIAYQASLSMEFSRQEYRSGSSCFPPKDLQDPGIKLISLMSSELAGRFFTIVPAGKYTACMHAKSLQSRLCNSMEPSRLLTPWDSPGKNTGVGCHALIINKDLLYSKGNSK